MKAYCQILALCILCACTGSQPDTKPPGLNAALRLFAPDLIVANFKNMHDTFSTVEVGAGSTAFLLPTGKSVTFDAEIEDWRTARDTTALLVAHRGKIVFEDYFLGTTKNDHLISWSVSKSYLSAAMGVMIDKGLIDSVDDPVAAYVPELKQTAYANARIKDVLRMSSGVAFNENYQWYWSDINRMGRVLALGGSMDAFTLGIKKQVSPAGAKWRYVSIDTHVLAMVMRNASGKSLPQLMTEYVLAPLQIGGGAYYLVDGQNVAFALGGLNLRPRDSVRFGEMMRLDGKFLGKQVVPADWVAQSTAASAPTDTGALRYGYQWWMPADARAGEFFAQGIYGQYIYVDRARETVIVMHAADRNFSAAGVLERNIAMFRKIAKTVQ